MVSWYGLQSAIGRQGERMDSMTASPCNLGDPQFSAQTVPAETISFSGETMENQIPLHQETI